MRGPPPLPWQMNGWSREQVAAEVVGGRSALASSCGIPSADIVGWRQPYLQASPTVRQVGAAAHPHGLSCSRWDGPWHDTRALAPCSGLV